VSADEKTRLRQVAWSRPNWSEPTRWKVVANARFYDCVRKMHAQDRNISFNTLRAVATPDIGALGSRVYKRTIPTWYTSWLKVYGETLRIVWIAKSGEIIEAHFAGSRSSCSHFLQVHSRVPNDARIVCTALSRLVPERILNKIEDGHTEMTNQPFAAWLMTNANQDAVCHGYALPEGSVQLDEQQEAIAKLQPPLIIESRSGTGKTLVLLQHAAYHSDRGDDRTACFVTIKSFAPQ
jgi:hypothetical protein